jgi:capsular polysaccharide biosynthesis protein
MPDLHLMIDPDGVCLKMNTAWEDYHGAYALERSYASFNLPLMVDNVIVNWQNFPRIERPALFSDLYMRNYFHFSLDLIPRLRLMPPDATLLIHEGMLEKAFQVDLLSATVGAHAVLPMRVPMRVVDPYCVFDKMCSDGILQLRALSGLRAAVGDRRIYLRRGGRGTRGHDGGGLAETPEFLAMLARQGFETVECGAGGLTVAAQVRLLDGAGVVLAPHGAGMTNITYLTPPVRIVEIMGPQAGRPLFMHVSAVLGFEHRVLYTRDYDEGGALCPDPAIIEAMIAA